jgi:peptide/nickel transport system substrate-binding protein
MMKRLIAAAVACAVLTAGCTKENTTQTGANTAGAGGTFTNIVSNHALSINTTTSEQNSWTQPHVLRLSDGEDIENLNPTLTQDTPVSLILAPLTMGYLVRWDRNTQPIPELITEIPTQANGGVSKDGLTVTYHIRKGVKWSDGVPFNADDVVFSFHAVLNPANNVVSRSGYDRITTIDEPDKYTVVLHFSKPYSPFLETFFSTAGANPCIMPAHLLANLPNINNAPYNAKPVGIGPFMVKEWSRGTRVVLVQNPYYFRGLPKLKEIDFEIITNFNTVLTSMQARSLDMVYQMPQNMLTEISALTTFNAWAQPSFYFRHIDFNLKSPKLQDPAVREALRYATDRATILAKLFHGVGILQEQPAPKVSAYWDPNISQVPFDLNKANQILDRAGWKRGPDGVREKNGVRLDLDFATASGTVVNDQLIELIRQTWHDIGVNITVSHYQNTLLFAAYQDNGVLYRGKFDVSYFAWGLDAIGDLSNLYACDQFPPNGQNILNWCNPAADRAMHALYAHFDQTQRNKDDAIVMEQLNKDVPTIVLMGTAALWVYNKDVKNFDPGALSPFDDFMNVDI